MPAVCPYVRVVMVQTRRSPKSKETSSASAEAVSSESARGPSNGNGRSGVWSFVRTHEWVAAAVAALIAVTSITLMVTLDAKELPTAEGVINLVEVTTDRATVKDHPSVSGVQIAEVGRGVVLPVLREADGYAQVLTLCEVEGWVSFDEVTKLAGDTRPTVVVDPGHGGLDPGAVGSGGLLEKDLVLDVSERLATLLESGAGGESMRAILTRTGDHSTGINYRVAMANHASADAVVSVHFNTGPERRSEVPGPEVYHQSDSPSSRRLAGLVYEELLASLGDFEGVEWRVSAFAGAGARLNPDGQDIYALLRNTEIPAVLAEVAVISNPVEEELFNGAAARQAVAQGLHRATTRFIETNDEGSGFRDPLTDRRPMRGAVHSRCIDPL
jgi:N-acetylmuramoyl-L-alanine amidase